MPEPDVFAVVADPTRRQILALLREGELTVSDLAERLHRAQPNVSKHLRVLRGADLARVRVDGPRRYYALDADRLRELDVWLAPFRRAWSGRLDALEAHLDDMPDE